MNFFLLLQLLRELKVVGSSFAAMHSFLSAVRSGLEDEASCVRRALGLAPVCCVKHTHTDLAVCVCMHTCDVCVSVAVLEYI